MRAVSLFSGCGGTDLGLIKAGFDIAFANDINKWACETYKANFGIDPVCGNIRKIKKFPKADLLVGCYPCQGFSLARRKKGNDDRNYLYLEFLRALNQIKPKFFITENVKGLLSAPAQNIFVDMIKKFSRNYRVSWKLINTKYYGVPQDRERVFIVGIRKDLKTKFEFPKFSHGIGKKGFVTLKDALKNMRKPKDDEVYNGSFSSHYLSRNRKRGWDEVSFTIQASGRHAPLHPSSDDMIYVEKDKWKFKKGGFYRRFSYRECAVIQTFPRRFKFLGPLEAKYMQVGNAVPPKIAEILGKQLINMFGN